MLGMNQYFYTFNGGNLYQHNANGSRNNFYGEQYNSQITTVFNQNPLENKIFKTINLESNEAWQANLETDIQQNGFIDSTWFIKKEGDYFAFLRQTGEVPALPGQYAMRSANGIGKSTSYTTVGNTTTLNFSTNPVVEIGNIVSIGDYLYFSLPDYTSINLGGKITNININIRAGINQISIDTSITGAKTITTQDAFILYIKSSVAESHGLLGHYCIFTLINESTNSTELFAVESEVMKSYP
jgi:fumarate reductase subunit C